MSKRLAAALTATRAAVHSPRLPPRPGGGMVDTRDLKSLDRKVVRVRVPPRAPPLQWGFLVFRGGRGGQPEPADTVDIRRVYRSIDYGATPSPPLTVLPSYRPRSVAWRRPAELQRIPRDSRAFLYRPPAAWFLFQRIALPPMTADVRTVRVLRRTIRIA